MSTPDETSRRLVDVSLLTEALHRFAKERNWEQFHSPKNLAMALTGEVGELSSLFQWMTEDASRDAAKNTSTAKAVRHELADVLIYVVRLADVLGVDLADAAAEKLLLNAEKYPIHKAHGNCKKYVEF